LKGIYQIKDINIIRDGAFSFYAKAEWCGADFQINIRNLKDIFILDFEKKFQSIQKFICDAKV
jgi:hypothetical protein